MYFIFSKILLFLLYPCFWAFILLAIAFFTKNAKRKKRWYISAVVVFYIFSIPLTLNLFDAAWSLKPYTGKQPAVYNCAIVLGGFSSTDSEGNGYFNGSSDRFIQGLKLLATGKAKHLLITGGNGNLMPGKFREGTWVKTQLQILHVPDSAVLIESNSRNTIENAVFSKPVLEKAGFKPPYLLVTSDFHMRRALMIFKKKGYDVVPYPCNYRIMPYGFAFTDLLPDGGAFSGWNMYLKELVGYIVD